jgi:hypothetical protein
MAMPGGLFPDGFPTPVYGKQYYDKKLIYQL